MGACGHKFPEPKLPDIAPTSHHDGQAPRPSGSPGGSPCSARLRSDNRKDTINSSQFILSNHGKVHDMYLMEDKKMGEGTYGAVVKGTHKPTNRVRAIKIITKGQMKNVERFKREIDIMKMMDHPNIIKLFETFEDARSVYLAMELCTGGELFDRIIEAGHLGEKEAATVIQQILRAICYMHDKQVCHRDLKPENFLFATKDALDKSVLKIIDFGLSCNFKTGQTMSTRAGTPYYVAPQVLQGKYDYLCDLWSVGVIMYILLCGYPPFYGRNDQEVLSKVKRGNFSFQEKDWGRISGDAKDLIRNLLRLDPNERFSASEALSHQWIKTTAPKSSANLLRSNPALIENLRNFSSQNKLKKAALTIIAGQLDDSQLRGLRETFTALDANGDGLLSLNELKAGIERAGIRRTDSYLQDLLEGMDTDGSGVIDYTEFLAAALDKRSYLSEQACLTAFKVFDLDGDGRISLDELRQVLDSQQAGDGLDAGRAAELIRDVDKDGDGTIDFKEFMAMMGAKGGKSFEYNSPTGRRRGGA